MATRIIPKKSVVDGKVPLPSDLMDGEIAVNLADAKFYAKHPDGSIVDLSGAPLVHTHEISDVNGLDTELSNASIKSKYEANANTNAYTDLERAKLGGVETGAQANVNADWNATSGDAEIINKPALGSAASQDTTDFASAAQGTKADTAYGWGEHRLAGYEKAANKGIPGGYAGLDNGGKVPAAQLPAFVDDVAEYPSQSAFPATGERGTIYVALDTNKAYRWSGSAYVYITSGAVDSVNGYTGVINLDTDDVVEGTNQYFTIARARTSISVAGDLTYDDITGVLTFNETYSTPEELMVALQTVDGPTSGLDADLLDGLDASQFLRSDEPNTHSISGVVWPNDIPSDFGAWNNNYAFKFEAGNNALSVITDSGIDYRRWGLQSGHTDGASANVYGDLELNPFGGDVTVNGAGNFIWHNGNMGTGSGMDADLLDGMHASQFAVVGHTHTAADLPETVVPGDNITVLTNDANYINASQAPIQTVAGRTGDVVLSYTDINGLTDAVVTTVEEIRAGTSADDVDLSNVRNVPSYSMTEADAAFVDAAGDDMTGSLRINTSDDGVNDLQVGGSTSMLGNNGFGNSDATENVDVSGDARIRNESRVKFGGAGSNDSSFAIQFNSATNSLDFNFIGS